MQKWEVNIQDNCVIGGKEWVENIGKFGSSPFGTAEGAQKVGKVKNCEGGENLQRRGRERLGNYRPRPWKKEKKN